jgi:hypothetical protein
MAYKVSDNAATTLATAISNSPSVTSLILTNAANFPVINHGGVGSDYTYVTLYDAVGNIETVRVTRRDTGSNTLTIVRGTAAGITGVTDVSCLAWASTTTGVACRLIAHFVNEMVSINVADHASQTTGAHAATAVSFNPASGIGSNTVQAAIEEVVSDTATAIASAINGAVQKDSATGAAQLPVGPDGDRPIGAAGKFRFNSTSGKFEGHNGTSWGSVGGGATGSAGNAAFYENDKAVTANYTITTNKNAMSAGPISINSGVTVTVPDGSTWTII